MARVTLTSMVGSSGEELRRARTAAGLSQEDLAEQIGKARRTVGEWERTGKIPEIYLPRLREILGEDVSLEEAAAPAPIEFTFEGTKITVHPNPKHTPDQVRRAARDIFDASMERLAQIERDG
jgi:transcriptional regulator with XRE-family HTH domain